MKIEFLVTGGYPGDGKRRPVTFPDPTQASVEIEGIPCLSLPKLVELKLASGMTNPGRLDGLGDVQKMIRILGLSDDLAEQLDPFVREKYLELWQSVKDNPLEP